MIMKDLSNMKTYSVGNVTSRMQLRYSENLTKNTETLTEIIACVVGKSIEFRGKSPVTYAKNAKRK